MKEFNFVVSGSPNSTFNQPLIATLVLSDTAVVSGIASAADIISFKLTAGAAIPDSNPTTLNDMHPQFLNPQVALSADRKAITAFTAENSNGPQFSYWLLYQNYPPNPTMHVVDNLVFLHPDSIRLESCVLPIPPSYYYSTFMGSWRQDGETFPSKTGSGYKLAIDPLALVLSSEVYIKLHLPDPPPFETIQTYIQDRIKGMSTKQKVQVRARLKALKAFAEAFEMELEPRKKKK
jgi:hypothetical protein